MQNLVDLIKTEAPSRSPSSAGRTQREMKDICPICPGGDGLPYGQNRVRSRQKTEREKGQQSSQARWGSQIGAECKELGQAGLAIGKGGLNQPKIVKKVNHVGNTQDIFCYPLKGRATSLERLAGTGAAHRHTVIIVILALPTHAQ